MKRVSTLLVLVLAGCGFLSRTKNTFYSLDTIPPDVAPASAGGAPAKAGATSVPIGIEGIELPPGIDRREIAVRGADQRLELRGTQLWAGPLEDMVIHTLAFDLANRLPEGMVVLPGQAKPAAVRSVYVVFEDLAPGADGVFVLDGRWTIAAPGQPERVQHERITIPTSTDGAQIAAAMSRALAQLADRIAAQL